MKEKPNLTPFPGSSGEIAVATFSMGCFWKPDALFGSVEGVISTRVGYTGGTSSAPTYLKLGDHIESIQLEYESTKISYPDLLEIFFSHHKAVGRPWKRQYMSAIFYHNEYQKEQADEAKTRHSAQIKQQLYTPLLPYEHFYLAEDRHQKYKLQRHPLLLAEMQQYYPEFAELVRSTTAARINGYLYGFGFKESLTPFIQELDLSPRAKEVLFSLRPAQKGVQCTG